jgi:GGDEF domain-containing protein
MSGPNQIFARTIYNQLVSSGRDRAAIIDVVNALLDQLLRASAQPTAVLVDPETGFPTRAGLSALLRHELDANRTDDRPAALVLLSAPGAPSTPVLAGILRARLRGTDFIVPLGEGRAAAVLYCDETAASVVAERLASALSNHSALGAAPVTVHVERLVRGQRVGPTWKRAIVGLRKAGEASAY